MQNSNTAAPGPCRGLCWNAMLCLIEPPAEPGADILNSETAQLIRKFLKRVLDSAQTDSQQIDVAVDAEELAAEFAALPRVFDIA